MTAFDCITTVIQGNTDSFLPLINMTFDLMVAKLADAKVRKSAPPLTIRRIDDVARCNARSTSGKRLRK
jgi:hypothetical protein